MPKILLALDPGLRELGFALTRGPKLLASGVRPLFLARKEHRVAEARRLLTQWLSAYDPDVVIVERTYAHPTGTFHSVHRLARALLRAAGARGYRTATYPPQTVRKVVAGNGNAPKSAIARVLAAKYPALRVYVTQDKKWKELYWQNLFDALALAEYHRSLSQPPSRSR